MPDNRPLSPDDAEVCQVSTFGHDCPVSAAVVVLCRVHTDPIGGVRVTLASPARVALCRFHAERHGLDALLHEDTKGCSIA